MKTKTFPGRLALNKHTVTNLNAEIMAKIVAGNALEEKPFFTMAPCTNYETCAFYSSCYSYFPICPETDTCVPVVSNACQKTK